MDREVDILGLHLDVLESEDMQVIFADSFIDWSDSYCMNTSRNCFKKIFDEREASVFDITYEGWHFKLRLDHILYSHHFKLENVYVEKSKFSDHRPLIADFSLLP